MPREKFQTLTEQMFYILLCLREACCGMDIMERIHVMTGGRVAVGPGTLYHLLDEFCEVGMIQEAACEGRKRSYLLTERGKAALEAEKRRLENRLSHYRQVFGEEDIR